MQTTVYGDIWVKPDSPLARILTTMVGRFSANAEIANRNSPTRKTSSAQWWCTFSHPRPPGVWPNQIPEVTADGLDDGMAAPAGPLDLLLSCSGGTDNADRLTGGQRLRGGRIEGDLWLGTGESECTRFYFVWVWPSDDDECLRISQVGAGQPVPEWVDGEKQRSGGVRLS